MRFGLPEGKNGGEDERRIPLLRCGRRRGRVVAEEKRVLLLCARIARVVDGVR
jgi:hypothetical protein